MIRGIFIASTPSISLFSSLSLPSSLRSIPLFLLSLLFSSLLLRRSASSSAQTSGRTPRLQLSVPPHQSSLHSPLLFQPPPPHFLSVSLLCLVSVSTEYLSHILILSRLKTSMLDVFPLSPLPSPSRLGRSSVALAAHQQSILLRSICLCWIWLG